jgi:hypothetical protein
LPPTGSRCSAWPRRWSSGGSIPSVTLYHAPDCHLCETARGELRTLRDELSFAYEEVDITGIPELEARYREWLPVVEIDGDRAFVYRIDEAELRELLRRV